MTLFALSQGASDAARRIEQASDRASARLLSPATFTRDAVIEEVLRVWDDCQCQNWDGYGATAVSWPAVEWTLQLIRSLPPGAPLPSAGADPDGDVTLEWHRHPRQTLSLSVSPDGVLHYAALLGSRRVRGSCPFFKRPPRDILRLIREVCAP